MILESGTAKQREELFKLIIEQAISVGVGIVDHEVIDRINILQATILAMQKSIENMNIQPEYTLIDGNLFKHETLKFQNIIGGDAKSFTIAAASIVAKVTRDRLMHELDICFPQYGFARHKGYGTRQHIEAIRTYGLRIHRRSFHPSALQEKLFIKILMFLLSKIRLCAMLLWIGCPAQIHYFGEANLLDPLFLDEGTFNEFENIV